MDVSDIRAIADGMRGEIRKAVVGQDEVIDLMLTSLLAGGHILLEGVPGTAKTLITRAFAASLALQFGRIQFTPDLMPGDVLGTNLFNFQTNSFHSHQGTDLHPAAARRRDQSHAAEDPGRAPAGHERAHRHHRRQGLRPWR